MVFYAQNLRKNHEKNHLNSRCIWNDRTRCKVWFGSTVARRRIRIRDYRMKDCCYDSCGPRQFINYNYFRLIFSDRNQCQQNIKTNIEKIPMQKIFKVKLCTCYLFLNNILLYMYKLQMSIVLTINGVRTIVARNWKWGMNLNYR